MKKIALSLMTLGLLQSTAALATAPTPVPAAIAEHNGPIRIAVIRNLGSDDNTTQFVAGALQEGKKLGFKISTFLSNGDDAKFQDFVNQAISQKYDGIILSQGRDPYSTALVKKAVDAGIKVAVFDTAVSGEIPGVTVSQQDDASLTELSFGQLVKDFNGKANIVKLADGNFLKAVHHIGETEYPDIEVQERLVDAMTAKMADPEFTKGCEVFVLPNLYGDIVTDAAAEMQGGLGSASSSNIGNKYALFEAIHGTAPFLINHGRGQYANPCSLIRAAGQLMAHIGYGDRTAKLEKALDICCNTEKKLVVTTDKDGATSEEFTTYLLDTLKSL